MPSHLLALRVGIRALVLLLCASLLIAMSACGGGGGGGSSTTPPPSEQPQPRTVHATRTITYMTDSGEVNVPDDTTKYPIAAYTPKQGGGFDTIAGTGAADGTINIANVPAGKYWFMNGTNSFVWTSASSLDMGFARLGRPDAVAAASGTTFNLAVTGVNPWQNGDDLQVYVSNNNSFWNDYNWSALVAPGDTVINRNISWNQGLVEGAKGDRTWVYQLSTISASGVPVQVLTKAAVPVTINQTQAGATPLAVNLSDVAQDRAVHPVLLGSQFAALQGGVNPAATIDGTYVYLDLQPGGSARGRVGSAPDLVVYYNSMGLLSNDVDVGTINYGNPFPAQWPVFVQYEHSMYMFYQLPGTTTPVRYNGAIGVQTTALDAPLRPLVGPVGAPTINGQNFFSNLTAIGTTPTVSWTRPAFGLPTHYALSVFGLSVASNGGTTSRFLANFITTETSITFPPGFLLSGSTYVFRVTAINNAGVDPGLIGVPTAPYRRVFPYGWADTLSGMLTP